MAGDKEQPQPQVGSRGAALTGEQAGVVIMRSGEWVRKLSKEGWITKQSDGKFFLLDVVQGYIRYRDDAERRATKTAAANRISDARAREIELRVARREGQLIEIDDVLPVIDELVGLFRTELSGFGARVTRDLETRRVIDGAANDILSKISEAAVKKQSALAEGGAAVEAFADDDAGQVGGGEQDLSRNGGGAGATRSSSDAVHR